MKSKYIVLLLIVLGSVQVESSSKKFVMGRTDGGLFSCLFAALNGLRYCEKEGLEPVIYWGSQSFYYNQAGHNASTEVWEYYFEPLSTLAYKGERLWEEYVAPDNERIPEPFSGQYYKVLDKVYRKQQYDLIKKYIKIKPVILSKVDSFYDKYLKGKKTIGIHLRGTDKHLEVISEATITSI